ncbi:MAG TPA: MoxR family ATPase [Thermoanaerobaculia bacterium]|nr:MoxR family ATPase [Thermoanaerobaculia bacterium]
MSESSPFDLYAAAGTTLAARKLGPPFFAMVGDEDPASYLADDGLCDAINVALALGQPLLLTGDPGTGKTRLAGSIAYQLGLLQPLRFDVKTTSAARDLFYRYDSLLHFHDSQFKEASPPVEKYITYEALGLAILLSKEPQEANAFLPEHLRDRGPIRSVVLIDEIDKAPRDLPNDVLNEIENMSFTVRETGNTFSADARFRPILVLTSNSEKNLPDAFLRRCVFYHIPFPGRAKLSQIVHRRLGPNPNFTATMLDHALRHFEEIRELDLKRRPATAELLAWIHLLRSLGIDVDDLKAGQAQQLDSSYSVLAKTKDDLDLIKARKRAGT